MEIKYEYNWHDYIMEYVLPTLIVILIVLVIILIIGTFIGVAFGYIKWEDNDEQSKDEQSKDEKPKDKKLKDKKFNKKLFDEYEQMMGKYEFIVQLGRNKLNVILPYELMKDENLDNAILEYIDNGTISEIEMKKLVSNYLKGKNYNYYLNIGYDGFRAINFEANSRFFGDRFVVMNANHLNNKNNTGDLLNLFGSLENLLTVKQNLKNSILSKEEYLKYKKYIMDLREIKIKNIANQYDNETFATKSNINYLIELEKEINQLKNKKMN